MESAIKLVERFIAGVTKPAPPRLGPINLAKELPPPAPSTLFYCIPPPLRYKWNCSRTEGRMQKKTDQETTQCSLMPGQASDSGIRDNYRHGLVADFLKQKIQDGSKL